MNTIATEGPSILVTVRSVDILEAKSILFQLEQKYVEKHFSKL